MPLELQGVLAIFHFPRNGAETSSALCLLEIFLVVQWITGDILRSGATRGRHLSSRCWMRRLGRWLKVSWVCLYFLCHVIWMNNTRVPRELPSLSSVCGEKKPSGPDLSILLTHDITNNTANGYSLLATIPERCWWLTDITGYILTYIELSRWCHI